MTSAAPHHSHQQMSEESVVTDTSSANSKRKRHRHESSSSQSKSSQEQSVPSLQSRRETFQTSKEGTGSSFRYVDFYHPFLTAVVFYQSIAYRDT